MTVDMTEIGEAKVTMKAYIEDVLVAAGLPGIACTQATEGLYVVREGAPKVTEHVRVWFHRIVAKLLYVAIRVRPECLTAVSFLSTRVTKCDEDDVEKLGRLVRYIRRTKDLGLVLRPGGAGISVRLFVDASFGYTQMESHTQEAVW
jgi:GTP cyclohydrolase II